MNLLFKYRFSYFDAVFIQIAVYLFTHGHYIAAPIVLLIAACVSAIGNSRLRD